MKRSFVLLLAGLLLFSSCEGSGENIMSEGNGENFMFGRIPKIFMSENDRADARIEEIVSAIKDEDGEALKALFSQKALDEIDDWDSQVDSFFSFFEGDIISWERNGGFASDGSVEYGKKNLMIRPTFNIVTDVDEYHFFLIDYTIDTIDPDNEGLYMLEVSKTSYDGEWEAWQDRMCAGISIIE